MLNRCGDSDSATMSSIVRTSISGVAGEISWIALRTAAATPAGSDPGPPPSARGIGRRAPREPVHRLAGCGGHAGWIGPRSHRKCEGNRAEPSPHRRRIELRQWPIQRRNRILVVESTILHVADDADDLSNHVGKECQRQSLAEWILVRPELS